MVTGGHYHSLKNYTCKLPGMHQCSFSSSTSYACTTLPSCIKALHTLHADTDAFAETFG